MYANSLPCNSLSDVSIEGMIGEQAKACAAQGCDMISIAPDVSEGDRLRQTC